MSRRVMSVHVERAGTGVADNGNDGDVGGRGRGTSAKRSVPDDANVPSAKSRHSRRIVVDISCDRCGEVNDQPTLGDGVMLANVTLRGDQTGWVCKACVQPDDEVMAVLGSGAALRGKYAVGELFGTFLRDRVELVDVGYAHLAGGPALAFRGEECPYCTYPVRLADDRAALGATDMAVAVTFLCAQRLAHACCLPTCVRCDEVVEDWAQMGEVDVDCSTVACTKCARGRCTRCDIDVVFDNDPGTNVRTATDRTTGKSTVSHRRCPDMFPK